MHTVGDWNVSQAFDLIVCNGGLLFGGVIKGAP